MTNPPYILDHLEAIAKIMNSDRVYKFLHVPIQSGSDVVLGDMKREYTADDFSRVVNVLRQKVPGITIGKIKGPIIYFFDGTLVMQVCIERKKMCKRNYCLKISKVKIKVVP